MKVTRLFKASTVVGNAFCKTNLSLNIEKLKIPEDCSLQEKYRHNGAYGLSIGVSEFTNKLRLEIKKRPKRPARMFLIKIFGSILCILIKATVRTTMKCTGKPKDGTRLKRLDSVRLVFFGTRL
jgi:hypothetical protein